MYLNEEEDSGEEECEIGYKEDYDDKNDNEENEDEQEEWYTISDRKFAPDPVPPPIYTPPLSWEDRDVILQ